jgi:23S rRNA pseudouridine2605 synthase
LGEERIQKVLASHGIGSRRQVEDWIREGRIQVNGQPATIGQTVKRSDRIRVDGRDVSRELSVRQSLRVIVYHKPGGEMLRQRGGDDRASVVSRLPSLRAGRWVPVNALGFDEGGLLILTNEGSLATQLARHGHAMPVEYRVRVLQPRGGESWPELAKSVRIDGKDVVFSAVERLESAATNTWFRIAAERTIPRGAIRALFDDAGLKISRILLVRWGPVGLARDLPRSRSRDLEGAELDELLSLAGRTKRSATPKPSAGKVRRGARATGRKRKPIAR